MANADTPFGFKPIGQHGAPYNGSTQRVAFTAATTTPCFIGDAVKIAGTSINGYPTVVQAGNGDAVLGVMNGFEADADNLAAVHRLTGINTNVRYGRMVSAAQGQEFVVQSDDTGTAFAEASVGLNADFIVGAGSTVTGLSGMELDSNTAAATSSLDLQVVALVDRADNLLSGTGSAQKEIVVQFNNPQTKSWRTGS